jgi:hypothetical protein
MRLHPSPRSCSTPGPTAPYSLASRAAVMPHCGGASVPPSVSLPSTRAARAPGCVSRYRPVLGVLGVVQRPERSHDAGAPPPSHSDSRARARSSGAGRGSEAKRARPCTGFSPHCRAAPCSTLTPARGSRGAPPMSTRPLPELCAVAVAALTVRHPTTLRSPCPVYPSACEKHGSTHPANAPGCPRMRFCRRPQVALARHAKRAQNASCALCGRSLATRSRFRRDFQPTTAKSPPHTRARPAEASSPSIQPTSPIVTPQLPNPNLHTHCTPYPVDATRVL